MSFLFLYQCLLEIILEIILRVIIFCLSHSWMAVMHRYNSWRAAEDDDDDDDDDDTIPSTDRCGISFIQIHMW